MLEQTFKSIDDVLWKKAGCTTELDYTEQTSWTLFLKYLDDLEQGELVALAECVVAGKAGCDLSPSSAIPAIALTALTKAGISDSPARLIRLLNEGGQMPLLRGGVHIKSLEIAGRPERFRKHGGFNEHHLGCLGL